MRANLYCKKHAKNQLIEFISFSFSDHIGVHSFLCIGAHFSVHIKQQFKDSRIQVKNYNLVCCAHPTIRRENNGIDI